MFLSAYRNNGIVNINQTGAFSYDDMSKYTFQVVSPKPLEEMEPDEMASVRGAYLCHLLNQGNGDRLFLKTHSLIGKLAGFPTIPETFTEGAIYAVRDPRDVVCSYAHHCDDNIDSTIDFILKPGAAINHGSRYHALGTWQEHVTSWLDPEVPFPRHIVRYEDMVENPTETFNGIVEFLGWKDASEYKEHEYKKLLEKAINATSFSKLKSQESKVGFREQSTSGVNFFRKGRVGSWEDQLTDKQEKRITEAFSELMEKLGYGCNSNRK
jgi:hypothetical protein